MNTKYIDIHGHLNFSAFDKDRDEVAKRATDLDVTFVTVGTQKDTSTKALTLAEKYNQFAIIGLHPIHTSKSFHDEAELGEGGKEFTSKGEKFDYDFYLSLAKKEKVVGIGECGLDFFHFDEDNEKIQIENFLMQIDLANEVKKPLMLHLRSGKEKNAYRDAFKILKDKVKVPIDLHFFAGGVEEVKMFLDIGAYFSFTGVVTFTKDYNEVVKYIPKDRIMSETDCPYVPPVPYRGKRNEPSYVIETVRKLAEIKSEECADFEKTIIKNAETFFKI